MYYLKQERQIPPPLLHHLLPHGAEVLINPRLQAAIQAVDSASNDKGRPRRMAPHPELGVRLAGVDFRLGVESEELGDLGFLADSSPIVVLDGAFQSKGLQRRH